MTDVLISAATDTKRRTPALATLACGIFGGFTLGVAARAWMRLISDSPEFTWSGTIFIVAGFTVFGTLQSVVAVARTRVRRRWALTTVRVIGIVAMMPLFVAAGAIMFPTVIGAGLARARSDWPRWVRILCVVVALGPVVLVARQLIDDFGWSLHSLAGLLVMLAIYGIIVRSTQFTLEPQADGWRLPRAVRIALLVLTPILFLLALVGAGGIK